MDEQRRRELDASLRARLAEQPDGTRVAWLAEQLENYVERWIGFAEAAAIPLQAELHGDLFGMVEIGARVMDGEVTRTSDAAVWRGFSDALARVRHGGAGAAELRGALTEVRHALRDESARSDAG